MKTHIALQRLDRSQPQLLINGWSLEQLALRAGRTPFYAYDRSLMVERVSQLRRQLPQRIGLHYAIKANPMPAVVQLMSGLVDGLDVASVGELRVALDTGIDPVRISFAGPAKGDDELAAAIASGVLINVESPGELGRIRRIADSHGSTARIALRVNPDFELKSSGMKMAAAPSPSVSMPKAFPNFSNRCVTAA